MKICPKCLGEKILTHYHKFGQEWGDKTEEHLHYYCQNCSYDETGPVADERILDVDEWFELLESRIKAKNFPRIQIVPLREFLKEIWEEFLPNLTPKPQKIKPLKIIYDDIQRRNGRCERCGSLVLLEKHHLEGRSSNTDLSESELNSSYLCHVCHQIMHNEDHTIPKWCRLVLKSNVCPVCLAPIYIKRYSSGEGLIQMPVLTLWCNEGHVFYLREFENDT